MFKIHSMKFSNVNKNQPRTGPRKKMYNIEKDKWGSIYLDLKSSITIKYCFIFPWHSDYFIILWLITISVTLKTKQYIVS